MHQCTQSSIITIYSSQNFLCAVRGLIDPFLGKPKGRTLQGPFLQPQVFRDSVCTDQEGKGRKASDSSQRLPGLTELVVLFDVYTTNFY